MDISLSSLIFYVGKDTFYLWMEIVHFFVAGKSSSIWSNWNLFLGKKIQCLGVALEKATNQQWVF